jgi:hypothetical protein
MMLQSPGMPDNQLSRFSAVVAYELLQIGGGAGALFGLHGLTQQLDSGKCQFQMHESQGWHSNTTHDRNSGNKQKNQLTPCASP